MAKLRTPEEKMTQDAINVRWAHFLAGCFVPVAGLDDIKEAAELLEEFRLLSVKEHQDKISELELLVASLKRGYRLPTDLGYVNCQDPLNGDVPCDNMSCDGCLALLCTSKPPEGVDND